MTKELLEKANDLDHDICILEDIKFEQDKQYWVGFRFPDNPDVDAFQSSEIIEDFKEFVRLEIEKAQKMFDELGEEKA